MTFPIYCQASSLNFFFFQGCNYHIISTIVLTELRGDRAIFFFIMKFSFFLLHCVPLYVCWLCINYQDLSATLLGVAALRMLLLTFTSRFVIDFLSIRKVIIFSAIATDDRHPLRSRSIHQNAANCMTIRFRYIAQPRGVRKTYCARSRK